MSIQVEIIFLVSLSKFDHARSNYSGTIRTRSLLYLGLCTNIEYWRLKKLIITITVDIIARYGER